MNQNTFYSVRLKILLSLMSMQKEIIDIHKHSKHECVNEPLKSLIRESKLMAQSEYLKKLQEQIREIHPEKQP